MKYTVEIAVMSTSSVTVDAADPYFAREKVAEMISGKELPPFLRAPAGSTAFVLCPHRTPEGFAADPAAAVAPVADNQAPITVREVRRALLTGEARVVDAERFGGTGPCCEIGDSWFYFDGDWDLDDDDVPEDVESPEAFLAAYLSQTTVEQVARLIADELAEMRRYNPDEWLFYREGLFEPVA